MEPGLVAPDVNLVSLRLNDPWNATDSAILI